MHFAMFLRKASVHMKQLFSEVVARHEGKLNRKYTGESYTSHTISGVAVERSYVFMTPGEFKDTYGVAARAVRG